MRAPRWIGLPLVAVLLVVATIGAQLAHGGGTYEPLRPADACVERPVTTQADGIDGLTERLVLIGLDDAACTLGTSRESLTLQLARSDEPTRAQVDALRDGLRSAVARMKADGTLPEASALVDEVLDSADLNGLLERVIRALPDSVIDGALKTDDVLDRTIDQLDVRAVLDDVDDPSALNDRIETAVTQAVKDSLRARLRDLV
ncbi:hypothetical protein [Aeromicrobium sp. Root472D3]|uniref:hypothetical protein n=1 Tax=Aeromicrobium sp. Root472D3 TaxID=1736540 RepID=UPI0006FDDAB1|nr:hypothetical protein [Aeromicrobium sp. Root472D3]KQX72406.1 hypothetical protein ASD10_15540 [Aeromicrobium sp. Root472D3]